MIRSRAQVEDAHRFAHVQHEDFPALAQGAGLQHELAGLGNRHEIAPHLRMRDGDRPAGGDLLLENRHHAAIGAQHVAEAHRDEMRPRCASRRLLYPLGARARPWM